GGKPKVKREHAYRTYAIRICEGPIAGVLRVWEDDKLVYDVRPESPILAESQKWIANKTIYLGDEEQLPDPVLQAQVSGASDTPAYRGTAYLLVDPEGLRERRGPVPQYRFEVTETMHADDLEKIPTKLWTRQTGGGNFSNGLNGTVKSFTDPDAGASTAWLALFEFQQYTGEVVTYRCIVLIDGAQVW